MSSPNVWLHLPRKPCGQELSSWQNLNYKWNFLSRYRAVVQSLSMSDPGTPWAAAHQAPLSCTVFQNCFRFMSTELVMLSNHLILCHPLLLLPLILPSIRVFSSESAFCIWSKYWSFSIRPSNEYSGLISFRIDRFDLQSKRLLRVFSSTTIQKHLFFSAQPSLWSNSHIRTRLLENLKLGLYGSLSAK